MRWGKTVLLFQAIVTLIIGIVFFSQVLSIDAHNISQAESTINSQNPLPITELDEIKFRYSTASYVLLFVSLMEIIIITRLLS